MAFTPKQGNWKFFANDAAEPTTQLANENTAPVVDLASPSAVLRLRATVLETGGTASGTAVAVVQYSRDELTWISLGLSALWNYQNGAALQGNTITSYKTSDGNAYGEYYEGSGNLAVFGASVNTEIDVAVGLNPQGLAYDLGTYYFRLLIDGNEVPLDTGKTHPSLSLETSQTGLIVSKNNAYTVLTVKKGLNVSKNNAYTVLTVKKGVSVSKANMYSVVRPVDPGINVSKLVAYTVLMPEDEGGFFFCHG